MFRVRIPNPVYLKPSCQTEKRAAGGQSCSSHDWSSSGPSALQKCVNLELTWWLLCQLPLSLHLITATSSCLAPTMWHQGMPLTSSGTWRSHCGISVVTPWSWMPHLHDIGLWSTANRDIKIVINHILKLNSHLINAVNVNLIRRADFTSHEHLQSYGKRYLSLIWQCRAHLGVHHKEVGAQNSTMWQLLCGCSETVTGGGCCIPPGVSNSTITATFPASTKSNHFRTFEGKVSLGDPPFCFWTEIHNTHFFQNYSSESTNVQK